MSSVPEMTLAGEDHRGAARVDQVDRISIAHRPARLDDRGHPRVQQFLWTIGKREERITGRDRASRAISGLLDRLASGADAIDLAAADADGRAVPGDNNRVAFHMLAGEPRQLQILALARR